MIYDKIMERGGCGGREGKFNGKVEIRGWELRYLIGRLFGD